MKITDEEINEIEAGPELDILVAEGLGYDVLGIALCALDYTEGYDIPYWPEGTHPRPVYLQNCICELRQPNDIDYFEHFAGCLEVVPEFSEDNYQALRLLEEYSWWKAESDLSEDGSICWHFRIREPPQHKWVSGIGETIALAICRALLRVFAQNQSISKES